MALQILKSAPHPLCAVPLKNFRGDTVAAMNVSVFAARVRMDGLVDKCLPALLQAQVRLRTL